MKAKAIGIMVIVIGIIMILITSLDFKTTEKVADLGPVQINKQESHPIHWSPIIGIVLIVGGIVIIVTDKNKT